MEKVQGLRASESQSSFVCSFGSAGGFLSGPATVSSVWALLPKELELWPDSGLEDWKRSSSGSWWDRKSSVGHPPLVMSPGAGNAGQSRWGMGCLPANTAGQ